MLAELHNAGPGRQSFPHITLRNIVALGSKSPMNREMIIWFVLDNIINYNVSLQSSTLHACMRMFAPHIKYIWLSQLNIILSSHPIIRCFCFMYWSFQFFLINIIKFSVNIQSFSVKDATYLINPTTMKYVCIYHGSQRDFFNLKSS